MRLFAMPALLIALAGVATTATGQPVPADPFAHTQAVDAALLDGYRGGFDTEAGLHVSLGIERIVTINGEVAEHSQLALGDLGRLIQNGGGRVDTRMGDGVLAATVIQNSLNGQLIRNETIINASVDARGMLQALNFQASLSSALNTAATGR